MTTTTDQRRTRQWADVLTIVTGVVLVASAMWPAVASMSPEGGVRQMTHPMATAAIRLVVGLAAIGALALAQRWQRRPAARGVLALGALVLLVGGFTLFRDFRAWEFWASVLPAIALLVAASGIGPMPR